MAGVSKEVKAQVAEATADSDDGPLMITVDGKQYEIPATPTVGYLAAVSDITEADESGDATLQMQATVALARALLGKQFRRLASADASVLQEVFEAAHKAYGVDDSGNSDSSPTS